MTSKHRSKTPWEKIMKRKELRMKDNTKNPFLRVGRKEEKNAGGFYYLTWEIVGDKKYILESLDKRDKREVMKDLRKGEIKTWDEAFGPVMKTGEIKADVFGKKAEITLMAPFEDLTPGLRVPKGFGERGVGIKLLNSFLEELKKRGVKTVVVNATVDNEGFYKKLGFKEVKVDKERGLVLMKKRI